MQMIVRDAHIGLLAVLRRHIDGGIAIPHRQKTITYVESSRAEPWSSATFNGQRHYLTLHCVGELASVEALIDGLGDVERADLKVRGHIVAEIAVVEVDISLAGPLPTARIAIEALTVED